MCFVRVRTWPVELQSFVSLSILYPFSLVSTVSTATETSSRIAKKHLKSCVFCLFLYALGICFQFSLGLCGFPQHCLKTQNPNPFEMSKYGNLPPPGLLLPSLRAILRARQDAFIPPSSRSHPYPLQDGLSSSSKMCQNLKFPFFTIAAWHLPRSPARPLPLFGARAG